MTGSVVRGVILRLATFGEADRMASVLCADGSRREVRVAQARRSRKRFGGLDLFVIADLRFAPNRKGRPSLQDAEIVEPMAGLRDELTRAALAGHLAELVIQVAQEEHGSEDLYRLTVAGLTAVATGAGDANPRGWARGFELKLLHVLGARPSLRRCAATGELLRPHTRLTWSTTHGGVLSPAGPTDARALPIGFEALVAMEGALRTPLADQAQVAWTATAAGQAEAVLRDFLAVHVGRRDRARRFLSDVVGGLAAVLVAALFTGCAGYVSPTAVRVQGWLYESTIPTSDTGVVSAASATAWDAAGEVAVEGSEPFSDAPGWYRFSDLPPETLHHYVFVPPAGEADHPEELGHVTTVIPGPSAVDDLFVDAGTFHLWPRPVVQGWATAWSLAGAAVIDLDPATADGGLIVGQVRDPAAAEGMALWLEADDGTRTDAWYTGPAGEPDPAAAALSEHGGFFFGQVPAGSVRLVAGTPDGSSSGGSLVLRVEDDAVTSLPALHVAP